MLENKIIENFNKIEFSSEQRFFIYINRLESALKEDWFTIDFSSQDLLYFEPSDMRFQDYDWIYHIIGCSKNEDKYYIKFLHMNWTNDKNITREIFKNSYENKISLEEFT